MADSILGHSEPSDFTANATNFNKGMEEGVLLHLDALAAIPDIDQRWLAIGRTHIEQAFMAINRAILKPQRISAHNEDSRVTEEKAEDQSGCD